MLVDCVARIESLDEESPTIAARIGTREQLPHLNTSQADTYDWSVLNPHFREIIQQVFQPDFEAFGYQVPAHTNLR